MSVACLTERNDAAFTVQVITRFYVAYKLITTGSLRDGATIVSLCSTGRDMPDLDVEDLSLLNRKPYPSWWTQSQRNTTVLDSLFLVIPPSVMEELMC